MIRSFTIIIALVFQTTLTLADFSPDGNQITFNLNVNNSSQIFISNTDGSNTKQISLENGEYFNPTWSPLGDFIAFNKIEGNKSYIGVMNIDGSNERMITTGHKIENPSWSNDGTKVLFYKMDESNNVELYIIDVTGWNEKKIK